MLIFDFIHKLTKLNKNLKVIGWSNEKLPLGLYLIYYGEPIHICGVDRNYLPENTITDKQGHIVKSGWRRILQILIRKRLVDHHQALKVFGTGKLIAPPRHIEVEKDATYRAMQDISLRRMQQKNGIAKDGGIIFTKQDVMDFRDVLKAARS